MKYQFFWILYGAAIGSVKGAEILRKVQERPSAAPAEDFQCFICPEGSTVSKPNGEVLIPGEAMRTCSELELASEEGEISEAQCTLIQSLSTLICECTVNPVDETSPEPTSPPSAQPEPIQTASPTVKSPSSSPTKTPVMVLASTSPRPTATITQAPTVATSKMPSTAPTTLAPVEVPTVAPTFDGMVTVYIRIHAENPQNIGWEIGDESMEEMRVAVPYNAYLPSDAEVVEQVTLTGGKRYLFVIKSKFGDDLGVDGSYEVLLGEEFGSQVLASGSGNFGEARVSLVDIPREEDLPQPMPTSAPIDAPTISIAPSSAPVPLAAPRETPGDVAAGAPTAEFPSSASPRVVVGFSWLLPSLAALITSIIATH